MSAYGTVTEFGGLQMTDSNALVRNIEQQIELLLRHAEILETLVESGRPVGILKLSKKTGFPPHQVRYSLRELESAKLVEATTRGAKVKEDAKSHLSKIKSDLSGVNESLDSFGSRIGSLSVRK